MAFSTLSRKLLGGGLVLSQIEAGKRGIRWDTLAQASARLKKMDKDARARRAVKDKPFQREAS